MSDMVERVARAICGTDGGRCPLDANSCEQPCGNGRCMATAEQLDLNGSRALARAAISAMELGPLMSPEIDGARKEMAYYENDTKPAIPWGRTWAAFNGVIDAALKGADATPSGRDSSR